MANSKETKQAIRLEIERLDQQKAPIKAKLAEVTAIKEKYSARLYEINTAIDKLKVDLNG